MADLLDYLDWRGDIPFSMDPFNEVDSLVLAEAAYVDFEGIVPGPGDSTGPWTSQKKGMPRISVADAVKRFWELHSKEEVERSGTLYKKAPYVLDRLCSGERFGNMYLAGYVNQVSSEKNEQMSAITFFLSDGSAFAAFRGTDDTLIGWKEDFTFSFLTETAGQKSASEYLNKMFGRGNNAVQFEKADGGQNTENLPEDYPIRVGGHSKGGNFAVYASAFCESAVRARIERIYTHDGPGVLEEITKTDEYREILPRVVSVIPEESLFGLLLDCGYYHKVIKSKEKGLWQHDALSWQILRNRFVEADGVSEGSIILKRAIEAWVYGMTPEERRETVDTIFALLEDTGFENVSEFGSEQLRSISELLRAYRDLSADEKNVLRESVVGIFRSGATSLSGELQERIAKHVEKIQRGQK